MPEPGARPGVGISPFAWLSSCPLKAYCPSCSRGAYGRGSWGMLGAPACGAGGFGPCPSSSSERTITTSGGALIPSLTRSPSTARTWIVIVPLRTMASPAFLRNTSMLSFPSQGCDGPAPVVPGWHSLLRLLEFLWSSLVVALQRPLARTNHFGRRLHPGHLWPSRVCVLRRLPSVRIHNTKFQHAPDLVYSSAGLCPTRLQRLPVSRVICAHKRLCPEKEAAPVC